MLAVLRPLVVSHIHSFRDDAAVHHTALAENLRERTRVDAGDGRDALAFQPLVQAFFGVPVAVFFTVIRHYESAGENTVSLEMFFKAVFAPFVGGDSVVAY